MIYSYSHHSILRINIARTNIARIIIRQPTFILRLFVPGFPRNPSFFVNSFLSRLLKDRDPIVAPIIKTKPVMPIRKKGVLGKSSWKASNPINNMNAPTTISNIYKKSSIRLPKVDLLSKSIGAFFVAATKARDNSSTAGMPAPPTRRNQRQV